MDNQQDNIIVVDAHFLRTLIDWIYTLDLSEIEKEDLFFQMLEEYWAVVGQ